MIKAKIGKKIITEHPELALPEKKRELLDAIATVYERDHAITITLDDADMAAVWMAVTPKDDLPQA